MGDETGEELGGDGVEEGMGVEGGDSNSDNCDIRRSVDITLAHNDTRV